MHASFPSPHLIHQATCLQTMYDYLMKASGYVDQMKDAIKAINEEHGCVRVVCACATQHNVRYIVCVFGCCVFV